jgi:ribonuclease P protein component
VAAFSFGKRLRLLSASEYSWCFANTQIKAACPELLIIASNNNLDQPRLGLVIAKKHVKLATQRNRLKRLIRENFRLRQHQLPALDIIVLARKGIADLDNAALSRVLEKQWRRLHKRALASPGTVEPKQC